MLIPRLFDAYWIRDLGRTATTSGEFECSPNSKNRQRPTVRTYDPPMRTTKIMSLRYAGQCDCGAEIAKGEKAAWDRTERKVICLVCLEPEVAQSEPDAAIETGIPGASLQREYERRMAKREARVTERFPRMGRLMLKMVAPAHTTKAFATGAEGEREVAKILEAKLGGDALVLYNRRRGLGKERGDIDMLVVAASGVHIIDPKKYVGRKVRANGARDTFLIDGRRRPNLSASMRRQINAVSAAMQSSPFPTVPVAAAYCFLGADLPWTRLHVDGVPAFGTRSVIKTLRQPGLLDAEQRRAIHAYLHSQFPPA